MQFRKLTLLLLGIAGLASGTPVWGETADVVAAAAPAASIGADTSSSDDSSGIPLIKDIGAYFTVPVHWDGHDWAWFGGAVLAVGAAHRYDSQVRSHFFGPGLVTNVNSQDTNDAIPTAAVLGGTWALAILTSDRDGYQEGWAMIEAAGLSGVTAYALKFAAGRETPDQTTNPNEWERSGSSFPSFHSTAAFAVGTVLAESGNDDFRWLRRILGYGLGVATSYERLKHNAHWLSDTVAGGALGMSTAHFVMDRRYGDNEESHLALVPVQGGAMLTYRMSFR